MHLLYRLPYLNRAVATRRGYFRAVGGPGDGRDVAGVARVREGQLLSAHVPDLHGLVVATDGYMLASGGPDHAVLNGGAILAH